MPPKSWRACGAIVLLGLAGCARTDTPPAAAAPATSVLRASAAPAAPAMRVDPAAAVPDDGAALFLPDMMAFLVDPAAGVLLAAADSEGQAEREPRSPEAWAAVAEAGEQLAQASEMLARPMLALQRSDWQGWVATMRDSAAAGVSAARRQDRLGLAAAGVRLRQACQACHALYAPAEHGPTALLSPR